MWVILYRQKDHNQEQNSLSPLLSLVVFHHYQLNLPEMFQKKSETLSFTNLQRLTIYDGVANIKN